MLLTALPCYSPAAFLMSKLSPTLPGDNILAVLKHLIMSDKLADSSEYRHGNMVFFDLLGVVVVAYPARVGTILNYMVATATFLYLAKKASLPGNGGRLRVLEPSLIPVKDVLGLIVSYPPSISQVGATSKIWPVPQV